MPYTDDKGTGTRIWRLGKSRTVSVLDCLAKILHEDDWFEAPLPGLNCQSGLIVFENGVPKLIDHSPDHRHRHVLNVLWKGKTLEHPPAGSHLHHLINGCFLDDPEGQEKALLLAEVGAAAALGLGTRLIAPKAVVLHGRSAANGKSQFLELFRALLPIEAVTSLTAQQLSEKDMRAKLPGVLLNASDELGTAAVRSDTFKSVITGDLQMARDLYKSACQFKPVAQHVLAANELPPFENGMDAGVVRRLLIVDFPRTIPEAERIPNIAGKIEAEESETLLAWIVAGASRLLQRNAFPTLASSTDLMAEWINLSDPLLSWVNDRDVVQVTGDRNDIIPAKQAYAYFKSWAGNTGIKPAHIVCQRKFTHRLGTRRIEGVSTKRLATGTQIVGLNIRHARPFSDGSAHKE